jgi:hypothetical protein
VSDLRSSGTIVVRDAELNAPRGITREERSPWNGIDLLDSPVDEALELIADDVARLWETSE